MRSSTTTIARMCSTFPGTRAWTPTSETRPSSWSEIEHITWPGYGDRATIRSNFLRGVNKWLDGVNRNRIGLSEEIRAYGNSMTDSAKLWHLGSNGFQISAGNQKGSAGDDGTDTEKPLEPPTIASGSAAPGFTILSASTYGKGGIFPRSLNWMRRPAGSGAAFERLEGQTAMSIIDIPDAPGSYEYRLDISDESGTRAEGTDILTLSVLDDRGDDTKEAGDSDPSPSPLILTAPFVPAGLADRASEAFRVTLTNSGTPGPVVLIPSSDLPGTFAPARLPLTAEAPSATFTFKPAAIGTHRISVTNDAGLPAPTPVSYTATLPLLPLAVPQPIAERRPSDAAGIIQQLAEPHNLAAPPRKIDRVPSLTGRRATRR